MSWKKVLLEGDAAVLSDTAPVNVDFNAASAGVATQASRQDHKHDITEGVVGDVKPVDGTSPSVGIVNGVARIDHIHGLGPLVANLNFNKKQATGMALDVQATPPSTPVDGQIYFNGTDDHPYVYVA